MENQQSNIFTAMREARAIQRRRMKSMVQSLQRVQQHSDLLKRNAQSGDDYSGLDIPMSLRLRFLSIP